MAKILGIESASLTASVAIADGDILVAEYTVNYAPEHPLAQGARTGGSRPAKNKKTHSQTLLPMIDEIITMTETDRQSIDAIAVSSGPGSFTGLRIGSATAKGLGQALGKPLVAVPTLDAMAYHIFGARSLICPLMDARRNQVYTGLYRNETEFQVIKKSCAIAMEELLEELNGMGEPVIFLGDGVPVQAERIQAAAKFPYSFAPVHLNRQKAGAVAVLGTVYYERGQTQTAAEHAPEYLRVSQAERELKERKGISLPC